MYIITIFIENLLCNANHPNYIVLTLQWQCSILALLITYKLYIQQESYKAQKRIVSCKSIACKNVLKRVIFQLRIYHTRYIAIY